MGQAGGRWSSPASGESLHLPLRLGGPPGPRGEGAGTQVGATRAVALGRRGGGQPLGRVRSVLPPWSTDVASRGGGPTWWPKEQPQPSGELFLHWLTDWPASGALGLDRAPGRGPGAGGPCSQLL